MYYVTDGLYCLSNQVIWQGSPFISKMQVLAVDSDDFVAWSTCGSSVVLLEAGEHLTSEFHYLYQALNKVQYYSILLMFFVMHSAEINCLI